jgi:tRNA(fMet)-specific endonuclease VapC
LRLLIDTSVAIALRDSEPGLMDRRKESSVLASISVITAVELEGGVTRSSAGAEERRAALDAMYEAFELLPFTPREARVYGEIVGRAGFVRSRITDRMIAATALTAGLPLATLNPRDFRDIPGLALEDWNE